jgi:NADH:ubiquinone oxidoreductase subunit 6 (subunit J)
MNFAELIFYIFAALTILCAGSIIFIKNVLYCALCLLGCFLGIAAIYVFAFADFLAIAQIMIYIGGVLVLLIFGIMLSRRLTGDKFIVAESRNIFVGIFAGAAFFGLLTYLMVKVNFSEIKWIAAYQSIGAPLSVKIIGKNLMTDFALSFEVSGIILMVALIGAAFIAGKNFNVKGKDDRD